MTSTRHIWILGAILIVLLGALNIQLLFERHDAPDAATGAPAPIPALPDDGGGQSGEALLREIDAMTAAITKPLEALRKDLRDATHANAAPVARLGPQLSALGRGTTGIQAALADLSATAHRLLQGTAVTKSLPAATAELRHLRLTALPTITSELGGLREDTRSLTQSIPELSGQLASTNATLSDLASTLRQTNKALDRTARCLRRPLVCD